MSRYGGSSGGGGGGRSSSDRGHKVYVGGLGESATKSDLERTFSSYGSLKSVWIARNPPGFAFVEFEDHRDASDAVKELDSTNICGQRARVELSNGESRRRGFGGGRGGGGGRDGGGGGFRGGRGPPGRDSKCYECGEAGHFARDCNRRRGGGGFSGGGGGRSSGRRSYSRSRSRSRSPYRRGGHSRSRSRSRSRSSPK